MNTLKSGLTLTAGVLFSLAIGKLIAYFLGGLPSSLYGMLIFCCILKLGWINADKIKPALTQCLSYMPLVFLPICVGIMNYTDLIQSFGLTLLVIGITTSLITISVVGLLAQYMTRHHE